MNMNMCDIIYDIITNLVQKFILGS